MCPSLTSANLDLVISLPEGSNNVVKMLNSRQIFKLTLKNGDVYNLYIPMSRHLNFTQNMQMTHFFINLLNKEGKNKPLHISYSPINQILEFLCTRHRK